MVEGAVGTVVSITARSISADFPEANRWLGQPGIFRRATEEEIARGNVVYQPPEGKEKERMKGPIKKAIKDIKGAGFGYIKVEMEALLNREDAARRCRSCERGQAQCTACEGRGVIVTPPNAQYMTETVTNCTACNGVGHSTCTACNGRYNQGTWSCTESHKFILDYVLREYYGSSYEEMRAANPVPPYTTERRAIFYGMPDLIYGWFYDDHSVDSEYTFTIPIDKVGVLPTYLKAFKALGRETDYMDVSGAGMHISVLPADSNGKYPCTTRMPRDKVDNFSVQMSKLLPALYFLSTPSHRHRALSYRIPRVSKDTKYSAIFTHGDTCFEYRVFETCYERPEAIFDFIGVIAKSLRFYADPKLTVKKLGKQFGITGDGNIGSNFSTPEQLRILNATVKHLKPEGKSLKQLKIERDVCATIKSLRIEQKKKIASLTQQYEEHKRRFEEIRQRPLNDVEKVTVDELMLEDGLSHSQAVQYVMDTRGGRMIGTFGEFLAGNLVRHSRTGQLLEV